MCLALLRLLDVASGVVTDPARRAAVAEQTRLVLVAAEARIAEDGDLRPVRALAADVLDATKK